jgi:hypothetical protein
LVTLAALDATAGLTAIAPLRAGAFLPAALLTVALGAVFAAVGFVLDDAAFFLIAMSDPMRGAGNRLHGDPGPQKLTL